MNFIKKRANVLALVAALALLGGQAIADWVASTPSGNVTVGSAVSGSVHFQKIVPTDLLGAQVGTTASPLVTGIAQGGNNVAVSAGGALSVNVSAIGGSAPSVSNPLPTSNVIGGAVASVTNPNPVQLSQGNAAVTSANPIPTTQIIAGSPVSTSNPVPVTTQVAPATYSIGYNLTTSSTPVDVLALQGSASKTIKITAASLGLQAGCTNTWFQIVRRSSANSGGQNNSSGAMKHDSADASPTAVPWSYTSANPGTAYGTLAGVLRVGVTANQGVSYRFGVSNDKPIYVRGTGDWVAISLISASGSCVIFPWIEWTEE